MDLAHSIAPVVRARRRPELKPPISLPGFSEILWKVRPNSFGNTILAIVPLAVFAQTVLGEFVERLF
jgi:hypothetical protein